LPFSGVDLNSPIFSFSYSGVEQLVFLLTFKFLGVEEAVFFLDLPMLISFSLEGWVTFGLILFFSEVMF